MLGFEWWTKRARPLRVDGCVRTEPVAGSPELVSCAPKRMIGGRDLLELMLEDAPDWADRLVDVE